MVVAGRPEAGPVDGLPPSTRAPEVAGLPRLQPDPDADPGQRPVPGLPPRRRLDEEGSNAVGDVDAQRFADALDLLGLGRRHFAVAEDAGDGREQALPREHVVGAVGEAGVEPERVLERVEQEPLLDGEAVVGDRALDGDPERALVGGAEVGGGEPERVGDVGDDVAVIAVEVAVGEPVVEDGLVERDPLGEERRREVDAPALRDPVAVGRAELGRALGRRDEVVELDVGVARGRASEERVGLGGEQVERSHAAEANGAATPALTAAGGVGTPKRLARTG